MLKEICKPQITDNIKVADTIILDIETTGVSYENDEILQVSIINASNGETLFNSYIRPCFKKTWKESERIHNISPEMVKDSPYIYQLITTINYIIRYAKTIIGYNISFDVGFLKNYGIKFPKVFLL